MRGQVFSIAVIPILAFSLAYGARADGPPEVQVDHSSDGPQAFRETAARNDQYIVLRVVRSCEEFKQTVTLLKKEKKSDGKRGLVPIPGPTKLADFGLCFLTDREIKIPHSEENGGYLVSLHSESPLIGVTPESGKATPEELFKKVVDKTCETKEKPPNVDVCKANPPFDLADFFTRNDPSKILADAGIKQVPLHDLGVTIAVRQAGPLLLDFAGGFTASFLTDPVYGLKQVPATGGAPAQTIVFQDHAAEDQLRLGVAAFVHVASTKLLKGYPAASFGLGVSNGGQVDYFFGLSARALGQAFLTVGAHLGRTRRLPDGLELGAPVTDQNTLANLPSRTTASFFFGVSYSFIGNAKDVLSKPFKPAAADTGNANP